MAVREDATPVLRVVRGEPSAEELTALVVVVFAQTEPRAQRRSAPGWADRSRLLRRPVRPGPGAWRVSALS